MERILIGVDDFSEEHTRQIKKAVQGWGEIDRISTNALDDVQKEKIKKCTVYVGWPKPELLIDSNVKLFQLGSSGHEAYQNVGLEHTDIKMCTAQGINAIGVAEHCIAMMFALSRKIHVHLSDLDIPFKK